MVKVERYDFSFTASSLRLNEMKIVAEAKVNHRDIDYVRELGKGKVSTGKRMLSEFNKRISFLTSRELSLLLNGDLIAQKQMAYLSVCKAYGFIRDFVVEVLREKMLVFDYEVTDGEYISFYRRKADLHPEMDNLTPITQRKVKQVTFKILEQSEIINSIKNKIIQPQIVDDVVAKAILSDSPKWLQMFLLSDHDIANLKS